MGEIKYKVKESDPSVFYGFPLSFEVVRFFGQSESR